MHASIKAFKYFQIVNWTLFVKIQLDTQFPDSNLMYSRGQKKRDTRCYSDTYQRREMKLVPFFMVKCPH